MTDQAKGVREWWIGWPDGETLEEVYEGSGIHVIERSAYDQLKAENERLQIERAGMYEAGVRITMECNQLRSQLTEATAALEFYARGNNWNTGDSNTYDKIDIEDISVEHEWEQVECGGKIAREVLAKIKHTEGEC